MNEEEFARHMYGRDDDDPSGFHRRENDDRIDSNHRSTMLRIGEREVEVPNMRYLMRLEKLLIEISRHVRHLETQHRHLKAALHKQTTEARDLWHELRSGL